MAEEGDCNWTEDDEGDWLTSCGDIFTLVGGSPGNFCYHCGKRIKAFHFKEDGDGDPGD